MNRFEQNSNPFGNFNIETLAEPAFRRELTRRRALLDQFVDRELAAWHTFQRLYRHLEATQGPAERVKTPDEIHDDLQDISERLGYEPPKKEVNLDPFPKMAATSPLHYNPRPGDLSAERYIRLTLWDGDDWDIPIPGIQ